jgi:hypothetical protein
MTISPAEAALKTQAQLAKVGRLEIWQQGKAVNVRFIAKLRGEPCEFQAQEPSLEEAMIMIAKMAKERVK